MKYKGYKAVVEFDADDGIYFGRILGIDDVVGFHAESVQAINKAFAEAVDDYVETCRQVARVYMPE